MARSIYRATRIFADFEDMLATDIDAVAIATPARSHFPLAQMALQAGKHVFVEKPLAMSVADAEALVELADRQGLTLMVGHVFEYNPAIRHMKQLLDAHAIGDLYYLYSTRVNLGRVQSDINALWSIAPHDVSILLYLLEQMPETVSARGARYLSGKVEDVVFFTLQFAGGVLAHVHASWLDPSKVRRMTVVGSKKMIVYDDLAAEGKVKIYDKGVIKSADAQYGEYQSRLHAGDIAIPKLPLLEPLRVECQDFIDAIVSGRPPHADGRNGLRVVKVLEAVQQSLQADSRPVTVG